MPSDILPEDIERYLNSLLPARDQVLDEMESYARQNNVPIVGPVVGRLLALLVGISGARRIFEMGSAIGYSTIWLARAAGEQAEVHYTDGSEANARLAAANFKRAGVAGRIQVHVVDSLELLRGAEGGFDIIFNDVDKHQYPDVFPLAMAKLRRGGLLIADNTLWHGRVATPPPRDRYTEAILEFNRLIYSSPHLESVIIPLRDGVSVSRKL